MTDGTDHDLIAAYALNALDDVDRRRFEAHLDDCTICAEELGSLQEAAASLAYALADTQPQTVLRDQILRRARGEHPAAVVARRRWHVALPRAVALTAVTVLCVVIGFSVWRLASPAAGGPGSRMADGIAAVVADPKARSIRLDGYAGRLVLAPGGRAVLVAGRFPPAPTGTTYEIWVTESLDQPRPAGSFSGGPGSLILLTRRVPTGSEVTVTRETSEVPIPTGPVVAQMDGTA